MGSCSVRRFICSHPLCPTQDGVAKQQARIFPTCPVSPHSLFPPVSAITLFLFLLSLWHSSKQAASCLNAPLLVTKLQHGGDAGPGGKLQTGEKLTAANREKRLISMSPLLSFCLLRESLRIASPSHQWSCSSLGVLTPLKCKKHKNWGELFTIITRQRWAPLGGRTDVNNYIFREQQITWLNPAES